jgi:acetate kinase
VPGRVDLAVIATHASAIPEIIPPDAVQRMLERESGLLGVPGIRADMRALLQSAAAEANEAVELFVYRIVREMGSMTTAAGGIDACSSSPRGSASMPGRFEATSARSWDGWESSWTKWRTVPTSTE